MLFVGFPQIQSFSLLWLLCFFCGGHDGGGTSAPKDRLLAGALPVLIGGRRCPSVYHLLALYLSFTVSFLIFPIYNFLKSSRHGGTHHHSALHRGRWIS